MRYRTRIVVVFNRLVAVVFFGAMLDETISGMAHRRQWKRMERAINYLFRDDTHCLRACVHETVRRNIAKERQSR